MGTVGQEGNTIEDLLVSWSPTCMYVHDVMKGDGMKKLGRVW